MSAYVTVDHVKTTLNLNGTEHDSQVRAAIEAASRTIDRLMYRRFLPVLATREYDWPQKDGLPDVLFLDDDLLALDSLTSGGQSIPVSDVSLEPPPSGPPYNRIRLLRGQFYTGRRSVSVTGTWGFPYRREAAVASLAAGTGASDTALTVDRLVPVGATLQIDAEWLYVTGRSPAGTGLTLAAPLTADISGDTVSLSGTGIQRGEILTIDSERMLVLDVSGPTAIVRRAYDGSRLADHTSGSPVRADRSLTVVRGVNGTVAAAHTNGSTVDRLAPVADIEGLAGAIAVAQYNAARGGWTGEIGSGERGTVETKFTGLHRAIDRVVSAYRRPSVGAV